MELSKFQESVRVLSGLKTILENDLRVLKRYIKDEDLKFSLYQKMLINIDSFSEEWKRMNNYAKENKSLRKTLSITSPAQKRIEKWKGIHGFRNTVLAHGFRDDGNDGKPTCLDKRYFSADVPNTYAETMLLAEYAVYAISAVICLHPEDHATAIYGANKKREPENNGITTMKEFEKDISSLQEHMFSIEPKLKECFGIKT